MFFNMGITFVEKKKYSHGLKKTVKKILTSFSI